MFRLLSIWWLACRYRFDNLLLDIHPSWWIRLIFLPALLFVNRTKVDQRGKNLRLLLEQIGPVAIKFGQLLSTRPDIVPKAIAQELNQLQDNVAKFPSNQSIAQIEQSLGATIGELFASFDETPIASASLAQVHTATLKTQHRPKVAVKVLRPNIERHIKRDMRLLRRLAKWVDRFVAEARRLRPIQLVEDYAMVIGQECDFRLEAANTQAMHDNFIGDPIHYTPKVYWQFTKRKVLVTEFMDAIAVTDIKQMQRYNINIPKLAENGVNIFFKQVFEHNCFHADMHPGNILVSKLYGDNPQYISIDCAIVGSLSDLELFQIGSLWLAVFEREYALAAEIMIASGWVRRSTQMAQLQSVIRALYEPMHDQPLSDVAFGYMLLDLFDQTRAFGLKLKPSQVLLQKTLINIEGLGKQLYPQLDMFSIAKTFLRQWLKRRITPEAMIKKWAFHGPMLLEQIHRLPALLSKLDEDIV